MHATRPSVGRPQLRSSYTTDQGSGGPSAFLMGAGDSSEQAVRGPGSALAMVAVPAGAAAFRSTSRLLRALDRPDVAVPVHRDNFEEPLSEPPRRDPAMDLDRCVAEVHRESPTSRIVVPDYRTTYGADMRAGTSAR